MFEAILSEAAERAASRRQRISHAIAALRGALEQFDDVEGRTVADTQTVIPTPRPVAPQPPQEMHRLQEELRQTTEDLIAAREELALMWKGINPRAQRPQTLAGAKVPPGVGEVRAFDDKGHKKRMGQILVEAGMLSDEELDDLVGAQNAEPHLRFGALAVSRGITSEQVIATILAAQLRLPYISLQAEPPQPEAVNVAPPHLLRLHKCLPWKIQEGRLLLAMENPLDLIAIEDLELSTKLRVDPVVVAASEIEASIREYYS